MKIKRMYVVIMVLAVFLVAGCTQNDVVNDEEKSSDGITPSLYGDSDKVIIYFFWGDGCPHCATQKPYLDEWEEKYGDDIEVKRFETWKNPSNVPLFKEVAQAYGIRAQGVPTTFIGEKHWVGFSPSMAGDIERYIQNCIENECESPLR